jgi:hypothetical protein
MWGSVAPEARFKNHAPEARFKNHAPDARFKNHAPDARFKNPAPEGRISERRLIVPGRGNRGWQPRSRWVTVEMIGLFLVETL